MKEMIESKNIMIETNEPIKAELEIGHQGARAERFNLFRRFRLRHCSIMFLGSSLVPANQTIGSTLSITPAKPLPVFANTNLAEGTSVRDILYTFAVGDLNEDGRPDLAVIAGEPTSVGLNNLALRVLLQATNGTLIHSADYQFNQLSNTPSQFQYVIAADFNEDHHLDILTGDFYASGDLVLFLGKGDGTLQPPRYLGISMADRYFAAADVNGDRHLDLLVDGAAGGVTVFFGQGDGSFVQGDQLSTEGEAETILTGDLNLDGKADVVVVTWVASSQTRNIEVFLGNGDGSFQASIVTSTGSQAGLYATLADVDGDGKLDYVAIDRPHNVVQIWIGLGDGNFIKGGSYYAGSNPNFLESGDVNGDGIVDLMIGGPDSQNEAPLSILLGNGDGRFQPRITYSVGAGRIAKQAALSDFNGDGRQDLVVMAIHPTLPNTLQLGLNQGAPADTKLGFLLSIQGAPGVTNALETSADLVNWSPILTNASPSGIWRYIDGNKGIAPGFYRTRSQ